MKIICRLFIAVLLFTACACSKDGINELPPATQAGANTFGCKINGVVYSCTGLWNPRFILSMEGVNYTFSDKTLSINTLFYKPKDYTFGMKLKYDGKLGVYSEFIERPFEHYDDESFVNITYYDNNILSGTFKMDITYDNGEHLIITHGRFDIKK